MGKVRVGMTVAEVESIMGKYIKGTGWPAMPGSSSEPRQLVSAGSDVSPTVVNSPTGELEIQDSIVYRHSDSGAFNSDWGVVRFENGRVVAKEFLPD